MGGHVQKILSNMLSKNPDFNGRSNSSRNRNQLLLLHSLAEPEIDRQSALWIAEIENVQWYSRLIDIQV